MLANQARRFGETLVDRHVLSRDDLEQAIEESERNKEALPSVLLRLALVGSKDLTAALAGPMGVRVGDEQLDDDLHINDLLDLVIQWGGSDLHLASGSPPVIRVNGDLRPVTDLPIFNGSQIRQMVFSILTQKQREKFEDNLELDTSYALPGRGRFRVNVFVQRDSVGCVMRAIPYDIVDFERLGIAPAVQAWAHMPRGLVLVTGPTGSGKSTTLASLIDIVNRERSVHIMTVEDPIEFLHSHKRSLINQREAGDGTK